MLPGRGLILLATLGTFVPSVYSQDRNVPVVDASTSAPVAQVGSSVAPRPSYSPAAPRGTGPAELLYQLENLQQEVQQLRGLAEQQAYELGQMRAEQRDRYLDLDRRIGLLGQNPAAPVTGAAPGSSPASGTSPTVTAPPSAGSEKSAYQAAFELIRNKDYDQAIVSLLQFTKDYPDGEYTGNAFYWLGEVYLVKSDRESALTAFGALLNKYPDHRKSADAKYKLGKVYRDLGEPVRAKQLFQEVVDQHAGTSAAKLAENELR